MSRGFMAGDDFIECVFEFPHPSVVTVFAEAHTAGCDSVEVSVIP